ncbi:hypothetical protein GGR50DRAFT_640703 [Xylaria sp. CBS 124048]|nr:hypothetical protein GGR50DRAFT_640703 [Xylaria sp. CBS 124048]
MPNAQCQMTTANIHPAPAPTSMGVTVTPDNHNPIIQVTTWLSLALFTVALGFRFLSTFYLKTNRLCRWDHMLIIISYLTAVAQSTTLLVPESKILGTNIENASEDELRKGIKVEFAAAILFIFAVGFAKLSVCASLHAFSVGAAHRLTCFAVVVLTMAWMLTSVLGTAFQCGSHPPWDNDGARCLDLHAFYRYVGIGNILTDAALVLVPFIIIYPLHMPFATRVIVISLFGSRILSVVATIFQLRHLSDYISHQFAVGSVPYYVSSQASEFASITAACVAYFWPFFRSVRSGFVSANITASRPSEPSSYALSRIPQVQQQAKRTTREMKNAFRESTFRDSQAEGYVKITTDLRVSSMVVDQGPVTELLFQRERYINSWAGPPISEKREEGRP